MERKYKIYVGCALSKAPESFRSSVAGMKNLLRANGFDVLESAFIDGKPKKGVNVYDYDLSNVRECNLFLPICDFPSIGLGVELEYAMRVKKPTLAFAKEGEYISKMVKDMLLKHNQPRIVEYNKMNEIVSVVVSRIVHVVECRDLPLFEAVN